MKILENFSQSKYGQADKNEDALVITDDFAAVIDGATDLSGLTVDGMTPGRYASQTVATGIKALPPEFTALEAINFLSDHLAKDKRKRTLPKGFRPFCVLAIYSKNRQEIFRLKDIQVKTNQSTFDDDIPAIQILTLMRQAYLNAVIANSIPVNDILKNDPYQKILKDICEKNNALLNNDKSTFGFGVIDGAMVPEKFIEVIPVQSGSEITITSDGYPVVKDSLANSEAALKEILQNDPLLIGEYPQPRGIVPNGISFDDRTWLKIRT